MDFLQHCYDKSCLLHEAHVRMITEIPKLKDGNGKEFCCLCDTLNQHLRASMLMDYEPSGLFITSLIETNFDQMTSNSYSMVVSVLLDLSLGSGQVAKKRARGRRLSALFLVTRPRVSTNKSDNTQRNHVLIVLLYASAHVQLHTSMNLIIYLDKSNPQPD